MANKCASARSDYKENYRVSSLHTIVSVSQVPSLNESDIDNDIPCSDEIFSRCISAKCAVNIVKRDNNLQTNARKFARDRSSGRSSLISNKFNKLALSDHSDPCKVTQCPVHSGQNVQNLPIDIKQLEESYWATWKPEREKSPKHEQRKKPNQVVKPRSSNNRNSLPNANLNKYEQCKKCFKFQEKQDEPKDKQMCCMNCMQRNLDVIFSESSEYDISTPKTVTQDKELNTFLESSTIEACNSTEYESSETSSTQLPFQAKQVSKTPEEPMKLVDEKCFTGNVRRRNVEPVNKPLKMFNYSEHGKVCEPLRLKCSKQNYYVVYNGAQQTTCGYNKNITNRNDCTARGVEQTILEKDKNIKDYVVNTGTVYPISKHEDANSKEFHTDESKRSKNEDADYETLIDQGETNLLNDHETAQVSRNCISRKSCTTQTTQPNTQNVTQTDSQHHCKSVQSNSENRSQNGAKDRLRSGSENVDTFSAQCGSPSCSLEFSQCNSQNVAQSSLQNAKPCKQSRSQSVQCSLQTVKSCKKCSSHNITQHSSQNVVNSHRQSDYQPRSQKDICLQTDSQNLNSENTAQNVNSCPTAMFHAKSQYSDQKFCTESATRIVSLQSQNILQPCLESDSQNIVQSRLESCPQNVVKRKHSKNVVEFCIPPGSQNVRKSSRSQSCYENSPQLDCLENLRQYDSTGCSQNVAQFRQQCVSNVCSQCNLKCPSKNVVQSHPPKSQHVETCPQFSSDVVCCCRQASSQSYSKNVADSCKQASESPTKCNVASCSQVGTPSSDEQFCAQCDPQFCSQNVSQPRSESISDTHRKYVIRYCQRCRAQLAQCPQSYSLQCPSQSHSQNSQFPPILQNFECLSQTCSQNVVDPPPPSLSSIPQSGFQCYLQNVKKPEPQSSSQSQLALPHANSFSQSSSQHTTQSDQHESDPKSIEITNRDYASGESKSDPQPTNHSREAILSLSIEKLVQNTSTPNQQRPISSNKLSDVQQNLINDKQVQESPNQLESHDVPQSDLDNSKALKELFSNSKREPEEISEEIVVNNVKPLDFPQENVVSKPITKKVTNNKILKGHSYPLKPRVKPGNPAKKAGRSPFV